MATHSSIAAWEIPWLQDSGRLGPCGHKSQTRLNTQTHTDVSSTEDEEPWLRTGVIRMKSSSCQDAFTYFHWKFTLKNQE